MKPHKHAEIIKAWADGAEVEFRELDSDSWEVAETPTFFPRFQWRIKPEPKPDFVAFAKIHAAFFGASFKWCFDENDDGPNIKLKFYGETGALKSAEVLK